MVAVKSPDSMSGSIIFDNILPVRDLEKLLILVGCKTHSINELDKIETRNLLLFLFCRDFV